MNEVDEKFYETYSKKTKIREYQGSGKKILGSFCSYTPEEIIHAAGLVPIRIFGERTDMEEVNTHVSSWICYYARRCLEDGLRGDYEFLDGIVSVTSDDTNMPMYSIWKKEVGANYAYLVQLPFAINEAAIKFYTKILKRFKRSLEEFYSVKITDQRLKESIKIYNRSRVLLQELYDLRMSMPPKISASDTLKIMLASYSMLKEEFNKLLEEYIADLKKSEPLNDGKVRVHVSGTVLHDVELLEIIEGCGVDIVSDDLCTGSRYFSFNVDETYEPIEALSRGYLSSKTTCMTCSRQGVYPLDERLSYIRDQVKASGADGVIILGDKGCDLCAYGLPTMRKELGKDIPILYLDVDFPLAAEQYKTRVEAFVESIKG